MTPSAKNTDIDAYIEALHPVQRAIAERLRELIHATVSACPESFKWGRPIFGPAGGFAYLKAHKNHMNIGFNKGAELDDPHGLLEGTGKGMRHIKLKTLTDIPEEPLIGFIQAAATDR